MGRTRDVAAFVTGSMTGVSVVPSGLRTTTDGSFISMRRQNRPRLSTQIVEKSSRRSAFRIKMMADNNDPLDPEELGRRQQIAVPPATAESAAPSGLISVPVAELQLPMSRLTMREVDGRTQILAEVENGGVPHLQPPQPAVEVVTPEGFAAMGLSEVEGSGGMPSDISSVRYFPTQAPREQMPIPREGMRRKKGGTIFGIDDRYTFKSDSYPWRITGQIRTAVGRCSGCIIGKRHVLTASHCVNWGPGDADPAGYISFSPAYYEGNRPYGEHYADRILSWLKAPSFLTDLQTAFDYVVLVMNDRIGEQVGYAGYRTYDGSWNDQERWQYIGYAGDLASGERPAFQGSCSVHANQSQSLSGNNAFVLGHFNDFTPGQSGGSAWGWWPDETFPRVIGVGSTIGSTNVQVPDGTTASDNEYGGGDSLSKLITYARDKYP